MHVQQTFIAHDIWEPLYKLTVNASPLEVELFQSEPVRRLKHIHHFGAGALFSPLVHSRYEHTVGVWALTTKFFTDNHELRIASLLHDVGHLPFSHTFEKALGCDHHANTESIICSKGISQILKRYGVNPAKIIEILQTDTPLSHNTSYLGLDHLDSFLRDTYLAGKYTMQPAQIIERIGFTNNFVETDMETGLQLLNAIVDDHKIFLNPYFLAVDALLSKAILLYCDYDLVEKQHIQMMVDYELLQLLKQSKLESVQKILHVLLWEPNKIRLYDKDTENAFKAEVRKIYEKQPLVKGKPISEMNVQANQKLCELKELCGTFYFSV